jgi:hypothetical protein
MGKNADLTFLWSADNAVRIHFTNLYISMNLHVWV